jgi:hypothetical protein
MQAGSPAGEPEAGPGTRLNGAPRPAPGAILGRFYAASVIPASLP